VSRHPLTFAESLHHRCGHADIQSFMYQLKRYALEVIIYFNVL
jgi:hypothetical protein